MTPGAVAAVKINRTIMPLAVDEVIKNHDCTAISFVKIVRVLSIGGDPVEG